VKRKKQVWWFILSIVAVIMAIFIVVLLAITGKGAHSQNSAAFANPAFTANLLAIQSAGDSSSPKEDEPAKRKQPVFLMQAASVSNVNGSFLAARQIAPYWEKSQPIKETLHLLNFFIPVLVIRVFAIFYRLARTGSGDDPIINQLNKLIAAGLFGPPEIHSRF
jgi:heme/copper-type cytochrome/quinol oxidase subunit 2